MSRKNYFSKSWDERIEKQNRKKNKKTLIHRDRMNTMSNATKSTKAKLYELNLNAAFKSWNRINVLYIYIPITVSTLIKEQGNQMGASYQNSALPKE